MKDGKATVRRWDWKIPERCSNKKAIPPVRTALEGEKKSRNAPENAEGKQRMKYEMQTL